MLDCSCESSAEHQALRKWSRQRDDIFALVVEFRAAARGQENRSVLRQSLDLIIRSLRDQYAVEVCLLRGALDFSEDAHQQRYAQIVAELEEFLERANRDDEPLSEFAHALDGVVVYQVRAESMLQS